MCNTDPTPTSQGTVLKKGWKICKRQRTRIPLARYCPLETWQGNYTHELSTIWFILLNWHELTWQCGWRKFYKLSYIDKEHGGGQWPLQRGEPVSSRDALPLTLSYLKWSDMDTYIKIRVNRRNRLCCAYEKIIYKREEGLNLEGNSGIWEEMKGGAWIIEIQY